MNRASSIAVALLVILAGCGALPNDDSGGARTVAPVLRGTPYPTPSPTPTHDYPPGVTVDSVDALVLGDAHDAALSGVPLTVYWNETFVAANGTTLATTRTVTETNGSRLRFTYIATGDRPGTTGRLQGRVSYWTDGTETVIRWVGPNGTVRYNYRSGGPSSTFYSKDTRERVVTYELYTWPLAPDGTVVRKGESLTVLRSTGPPEFVVGPTNVRNASLVAYVTADGVVRSFTARYTAEFNGITATRTVTFRVTDLFETKVPQPSWYDEAVNSTAANSTATNSTG